MKKTLALILVLVLAASLFAVFAACGPTQQKPDFEIPEGGYDGSEVTIKFYSSMGQDYNNILNEYIEKFNVLFPNITIDHQRIGDYDSVRDQIKTELGNGKSPDIAFCYSDHVAMYNRSRAIVKLDDLINSDIEIEHADGETSEILGLTDEQKADFIEAYYNEGKAFGDDKMYMLPFAKSTELMYYNKTSFEEWGLQVPDHWFASDGKYGLETSDKTSMEYVLAFIKSKDANSTPLGYDAGDNWLITLFEQFGTGYTKATGDHYLFDNEDNYKILATLRRWYQNNLFTTKGLLGGNTYTSTYFTSVSSEQGKKSYISIGSSAGAAKQVPAKVSNQYPFEVGVTMIPQKEAGLTSNPANCKVISQGPSICLFNSGDPQKVVASWLLMKYLVTNSEFEARYGLQAGYLPVVKSVESLSVYANAISNADTGEHMSGMAAKLCKEYRDAFFVSPAFYGSAEARSQMDTLLNKCVMVQGSSEQNIMDQIKTQFKNALAECEY